MKKLTLVLYIFFIGLISFLFIGGTKVHASELFEDEFDGKSLENSWIILRENQSDISLTESPGHLRIISKAEDLWQINVNNKIKLLRRGPHGDFEIVARLTYDPKEKFQQAGIILYEDEENYVMLTAKKMTHSTS